MRIASKRAGVIAAFSAVLAVAATGIVAGTAVGAATPAVAYRLSATLTPSQVVPAVQAPAGAVGHFHGVLIRSGAASTRVAALAGCKIVQPPKRSGLPTRINCGGTVGTVPGASGQWRLLWRLSVSGLSGPAQSAAIHIAPVGHSAAPMSRLCAPCAKISHGQLSVTPDQANSLIANAAYVDVSTAAHPDGEIRGQIVRASIGFRLGR